MNLPDYTVDEKSHLQALVWPRLTGRGRRGISGLLVMSVPERY